MNSSDCCEVSNTSVEASSASPVVIDWKELPSQAVAKDRPLPDSEPSTDNIPTITPTNLGTVEVIEEVKAHPNADKIELVRVINFWAIVPKGRFNPGDRIIYIRPDSYLPVDQKWSQSFLSYTKKGRVRAVRLRGEWSEGIVLGKTNKEVGTDMTKMLYLVKHEPGIPKNLAAKGGLPFEVPKTDEDNWRAVRRMVDYVGQKVDVSLKRDGQSCTIMCVLPGHHPELADAKGPYLGVCSRSLELKIDPEFNNQWLSAERKYNALIRLHDYCRLNGVSLAIRGEVTGPGIQNFDHNPHSKEPLDFRMYSVYNITAGRYEGREDPHYYTKVAAKLGIPAIEMLEEGVELSLSLLEKYDSQVERINGQPFEGVVVKGSSFSFKVLNKFYDSKK